MTGWVVAGYTATDAGADAAALGARLALAQGTGLELVVVLPGDDRSVITPPDAGYDRFLTEQAETWLAQAAARLPEQLEVRTRVVFAESFAQGLVAAAHERAASAIVVGAANGGFRGRHRLGTVAGELLHSADVPVVLAPEGSRLIDPTLGVGRVTAALGTRPGGPVLIDTVTALAAAASAPLRLISLVTLDLPAGLNTGAISVAQTAHVGDVLAAARAGLPAGADVDVAIGEGESVEEAVALIPWDPTEIAVVGSSRLAQPRRLFLGSTAAKMLHELPVPLMVVPRTLGEGTSSETGGR